MRNIKKSVNKTVFLVILFYFFSLTIPIGLCQIPPTGRLVTTHIEDTDRSAFDSINKIYEISPSSLEQGYTTEFGQNDSFRLAILGKRHYIIVSQIDETEVEILVSGKQGKIVLGPDEYKIIEFQNTESYKERVKLTLNYINNGIAGLHIKTFKEEISPAEYKELFDIEVGLAKNKIYSSSELDVYIRFFNFGDGPSHVNIIYSIFNENNTEVYRGVDDKIVYTEDSIVKNFNFLNLRLGRYKIVSEIFYGKNQTAIAEKSFDVVKKRFPTRDTILLALLSVFFVIFIVLFFIKRLNSSGGR
jgi:hypothetical protein